MSLAGTGVVAIWHDLLPEAKNEFYEWHNREHMPERAESLGSGAGGVTLRWTRAPSTSISMKPTP
ncbi:hypothetical protein [Caballeronia grimmiae]|uniref:Uncharacterized protein n=1 Tax=Caballeronia grimmiae TaxID=1071679 RepID=A0ABQ1RMS0_9BURK|nr:hypothetical protein [Caballeronia grimmiae]GGD75677.1 hypothetical protein GCM10010985_32750 [Caballeronia grimmiae]